MTRFVVTCFARTGGSWLCQLLNSHPAILCHGELFNLRRIGWTGDDDANSALTTAWPEANRDADPSAFLEAVFADDRGHESVGFKLLNWHRPELLRDLVAQPRVHRVILQRENRVAVFLSRTRAQLTGWYAHRDYDDLRVRLEPDELLAFVRRYDRFYAQMDESTRDSPALFLSYDRLGDPATHSTLVDFLEVSPRDLPLSASIRPQSRGSLRAAITNYDELRAALAGTALLEELEG